MYGRGVLPSRPAYDTSATSGRSASSFSDPNQDRGGSWWGQGMGAGGIWRRRSCGYVHVHACCMLYFVVPSSRYIEVFV